MHDPRVRPGKLSLLNYRGFSDINRSILLKITKKKSKNISNIGFWRLKE